MKVAGHVLAIVARTLATAAGVVCAALAVLAIGAGVCCIALLALASDLDMGWAAPPAVGKTT